MTPAAQQSPIKKERDIMYETLACFALNLPSLQDDVTEKLAKTYAGKKEPKKIEEDITQLKTELVYKIPQADDFVAKIMLDQITTPAASLELRVIKNSEAVKKFQNALAFDQKFYDKLINYYASPASLMFFDEEMAKALVKNGYKSGTDIKAAQKAADALVRKISQHKNNSKENAAAVEQYTVKYHIAFFPAKLLLDRYSKVGAKLFKPKFDDMLKQLQEVNDNESLNSFLTVKYMLGALTQQDALNMAVLTKEIEYKLLEEDIFIIGCRYLKHKTPGEVAYTLDALLKSLPYNNIKEENLGLAINVLTEGSADSLESARASAQRIKDRSAFRRQLSKYDCFDGFTHDIAKRFSGRCKTEELLYHFEQILNDLPYCSTIQENHDLANKVLLDKVSLADAQEQALYRKNLKAKSLTEGLAPEVLKKYLGTKQPEEIIEFFEENLSSYNFWRNDEPKHRFALEVLIDNLNGTQGEDLTKYVMDALESDGNPAELRTLVSSIAPRKKFRINKNDLDKIFKHMSFATEIVQMDVTSPPLDEVDDDVVIDEDLLEQPQNELTQQDDFAPAATEVQETEEDIIILESSEAEPAEEEKEKEKDPSLDSIFD